MFITDKIIFLELQKTGGTHICSLLEKYAGGRTQGKHNRIQADVADRFMLGSIRNPWDWYVSLWAFGVGGKGAVRHRLVRGLDAAYYHNQLPAAMGIKNLGVMQALQMIWHDILKPVSQWQASYADQDDATLFRQWLSMLLSHERRFDMGEGFAFSPLSHHAGLLTYRFFRLYTTGNDVYADKRLGSYDSLASFDEERNICHGIIRTGSLVEDLIDAMAASGTVLSEEHVAELRANDAVRTNSSRHNSTDYYYDQKTADLVADRDRYLIEKFGFEPPAF